MAHILYDEDITVDGLEVHVLRKTVKNGTITVGLDGRVTYSAPPSYTRAQIEKHIREEMPCRRFHDKRIHIGFSGVPHHPLYVP